MKKKSNYIRDRLAQGPVSRKARKYCFNKSKKLRKGDTVRVIAGNNIDKSGVILSYNGDRVIIQGVNVGKKTVKSKGSTQPGTTLELERSIHISNVVVCNAEKKPLKLKMKLSTNGEKQLVSHAGGQEMLHRSIKKS